MKREIPATVFILLVVFSKIAIAQPQGPDVLWTRIYESLYEERSLLAVVQGNNRYAIVFGLQDIEGDRLGYGILTVDGNGDTVRNALVWHEEGIVVNAGCASSEGGFMLAGDRSASEFFPYLVLADSTGNPIWQRDYGYIGSGGHTNSIQRSNDGGYLVVGDVQTSYGIAVRVFKITSQGDTVWTREYSPYGQAISIGTDILPISDGGAVVVGYTAPLTNPSSSSICAIRLNSQGDTVWTRRFEGDLPSEAHTVASQADDGFVIGGMRKRNDQLQEIYVIRCDWQGEQVWDYIYGIPSTYAGATTFQDATNHGIYVGGWLQGGAQSSFALLRLTADGDPVWTSRFQLESLATLGHFMSLEDGGLLLAGTLFSLESFTDNVLLIRTEPDNVSIGPVEPAIPDLWLEQNHPNPFNNLTQIDFYVNKNGPANIEIFNLAGQHVASILQSWIASGRHTVVFNGCDQASGLYFYRLTTSTGSATKTMTLLK